MHREEDCFRWSDNQLEHLELFANDRMMKYLKSDAGEVARMERSNYGYYGFVEI